MAMHIQILGPDGIGAPSVILRVSGDYAPDVMHDLRERAIETYLELFTEPDVETPIEVAPTDKDQAA